MNLSDNVQNSLKDAMRAKDQTALRSLRAIKSAIILLQTEKGGSKELSEEAEIKLLQKLVKQRKDSAEIFSQQNREELAIKEKEEIEVIQQFLPKQMSEDDLKVELVKIISITGASGMKDMGKIMGMASSRFAGQVDNKIMAALIKQLLPGDGN